jgi:uncharacterized LabA/DUF88 family protein
MKLRLFIDFWNFSLNWNDRSGGAQCDWSCLPLVLAQEAQTLLGNAGLGNLSLEETRVYASYEPGREAKLKGWLHNFLDKQPGIRVFAVERHWKKHTIHCRACGTDFATCPSCQADLGRAAEKTVDSRIVTDMLSLSWEGAYDIALLLSSDRDFIPAVDRLQSKNFKVLNATWRGHGHELAKVCWASFELDSVIQKLKR